MNTLPIELINVINTYSCNEDFGLLFDISEELCIFKLKLYVYQNVSIITLSILPEGIVTVAV